MKSLCGWIGWIVGMFLGFALVNSIPFLGVVCIIGGIPLGRYIGGLIEEEQDNQRRAAEEEERKRRQEEYERVRKEQERLAAENEKKRQDYIELENLQKIYPHAFIEICNRTLRGIIYNDAITMPGRKSNRQKRNENSSPWGKMLTPSPFETIRDYSLKYYNNRYRPIGVDSFGGYSNPRWGRSDKSNTYYREPKSIRDLFYEDVKKLLLHKDEFRETEETIVRTLKNEEISIAYDDKVLDDEVRSKHVKDFLIDNERELTDKEFVVKNLHRLDEYISDLQTERYLRIKRQYPDGIKVYESYNSKVIARIVKDEETIKTYNTYAKQFLSYIEWEEEQKKHASKSRDCSPAGYGCYSYDIEFKRIAKDGKEKKGTYKVWQHFRSAYFFDDRYMLNSDLQYLHDNAVENTSFLNRVLRYVDSIYDKTFEFIVNLKNQFGNLTVLWGDSDFIDSDSLNKYHFEYLRYKLDNANIHHFDLNKIDAKKLTRNVIIVELITGNSCLKYNCQYLIQKFADVKPLITYLSIRKGYDPSEIENLIENRNRKRKEKEQIELRERERQEKLEKEKRQREELIKTLKGSLSSGFTLPLTTIKCFSLYNYYPTTCTFEATQEEWDTRNLIWDFKANPVKSLSTTEIMNKHRKAENIIVKQMVKALTHFYGKNISKLTLICVPSSKQIVNERRYKTFSERLCEETGMENGYEFVRIEKDGEASHLGGTTKVQYLIDGNTVSNKCIILFDDVITTGKSMNKLKNDLESFGGTVVGCFSIGRTRHERQDFNSIDLL